MQPWKSSHDPGAPLASVEDYFSNFCEKAAGAERQVRSLQKAIAKTRKALEVGDVALLTKAISDVMIAIERARELTSELVCINLADIERAYGQEHYFREIAELAKAGGVTGVRSTEGKLFSYPYVIERKKAGTALAMGSRSIKSIRPSAVVKAILQVRARGSRFSRADLLESVERLYHLKRRGRETDLVAIDEIYGLLTALPGADKEYPLMDFLGNLDEIRRLGPQKTKSGHMIDFVVPSTTSKGGRGYRIITEDGREQPYHMLRFVATGSSAPRLL